jgi:uncharacterized protein YcaQ
MLDYQHRHKGWTKFLKRHPRLLRSVEATILERGPLGNADFQEARPGKAGWWSWKPATHALDFLWMSGRTTVHSRQHFQKRFDLMDRVLPDAVAREALDTAAFRRWHLGAHCAMGAATDTDLRMYLTFPRTAAAERARTLRGMIRAGDVVEIGVEGDRGRWYALARDLPSLAAAGRLVPDRAARRCSPFDSFLWHRERIVRPGYDYRIQVYVPPGKRTFGYYALQLLVDGQLIGRVDAKLHRAERRLELRHVSFEPWFAAQAPPPGAAWGSLSREDGIAGLAEAALSLAHFTGAERVEVSRVTPAVLRARVVTALGARRSVTAPAARAARRARVAAMRRRNPA